MRQNLRLALVAAAFSFLPFAAAPAAELHRPKLEWRTRTMSIDLPAERGASTERELQVDAAGRATLSWSPERSQREVEITIVHRPTGKVIFARSFCDAATVGFAVEDCLLQQGKHFDVHVRSLGRRPHAVCGTLSVQRLMRKD